MIWPIIADSGSIAAVCSVAVMNHYGNRRSIVESNRGRFNCYSGAEWIAAISAAI